MGQPPRVAGDDWALEDYRKFVETHVRPVRDWYRRRARLNRFAFRSMGIVVIVLSPLLPLLAGFDFEHKDLTLGLIGVAIAIATGLRTFYQWDHLWSLLRQTDFELTELLTNWELAVASARSADEVQALTEDLLRKANDVRRAESKGYFATLRFPKSDEQDARLQSRPGGEGGTEASG